MSTGGRSFRCYPLEMMSALRALCPIGQAIYFQALMMHFKPETMYSDAGGSIPADPRRIRLIIGGGSTASIRRALKDLVDLHNITIVGDQIIPRVPWDEDSASSSRPNITASLRETVIARDGERCRYCGGEGGPFDIDHIVPLSRGGLHQISNLGVACATCNRSKGAKLLSEWLPIGAAS